MSQNRSCQSIRTVRAVGGAPILKLLVDVEVTTTDRATVEAFENTVAAYEEVLEFRRIFGRPDYLLRTTSHLTMKKIKADGVAMPQSSLAKRRQT